MFRYSNTIENPTNLYFFPKEESYLNGKIYLNKKILQLKKLINNPDSIISNSPNIVFYKLGNELISISKSMFIFFGSLIGFLLAILLVVFKNSYLKLKKR